MKEQEIYQLIDSYLNDELNAEDKMTVESRIQNEPEFAETFSILEKVYGKVEDKGALNLVHRLHELNEKYPVDEIDLTIDEAAAPPQTSTSKSPDVTTKSAETPSSEGSGGLWKILLPIALLGGALLFYFMNKGGETFPQIEDIKKEIPLNTPEENKTPTEEKQIEQKIEEPVKEEKVPEKKAPPKKEEKPKPKLYAAADFETNAMLDKMIGTTTRSELAFEVTSPKLNQNFPESTATVSFSGTTNSADSQQGTFRLLNNKRVDISQQTISASDKFNFSAKIPKPGLYYYTLKLGSKTYVGKFNVGKK